MQKGEIATFVIFMGIAVMIAGVVMGNFLVRPNRQNIPNRRVQNMTPPSRTPTTVPKQSTLRVDLTVENISRTSSGYKLYYCNRGTWKTKETFSVELENRENNKVHISSSDFTIPAADSCTWSTRIDCSIIGSTCRDAIRVDATIDGANLVPEQNETNNTYTGRFDAR